MAEYVQKKKFIIILYKPTTKLCYTLLNLHVKKAVQMTVPEKSRWDIFISKLQANFS